MYYVCDLLKSDIKKENSLPLKVSQLIDLNLMPVYVLYVFIYFVERICGILESIILSIAYVSNISPSFFTPPCC